jgi:hypothetical protein
MTPAPAPPLSLSTPLVSPTELAAVIRYLNWLADALPASTAPGTGPWLLGQVLCGLMGATLEAVFGRNGKPLAELYDLANEWAKAQPTGIAGLTVGEAVRQRVDVPGRLGTEPDRN